MAQSFKRGYVLAAMSILLATFAQLAMKWGMSHLSLLHGNVFSIDEWWASRYALFLVASGIAAYALSMFCWLLTLSHLPLNKAYPLLSVSYVLVYFASLLLPWFHEVFSVMQLLGVAAICVGVWLIVTSNADQKK